MDEPESVIRRLKQIAETRKGDKRWEGISRLCDRAQEYFDHINQPRPNSPVR